MGCHDQGKILILVAVFVVAWVQAAIVTVEDPNFVGELDWGHATNDIYDVNFLCGQCDNVCPKGSSLTREETKKLDALHWACFIGCRATCLLQSGSEKRNYETSKNLCVQGCHSEYKTKDVMNNLLLQQCREGCCAKVVPPNMIEAVVPKLFPLDINDDTEDIMIDQSFDIRNGILSHSSYKTIPHKESIVGMYYTNIKQRLVDKSTIEHVLSVMKDPKTDPILAGAFAIPLFLALFGLMCYLLYLVSVSKRTRNGNEHLCPNDVLEGQQSSFTLLHVDLDSEEKKALLSQLDIDTDDEFVPPSSPPPKYSEIV